MPKRPTYGELQRRVAELEAQQQLLTDITGRKRAEQVLDEIEERFRVAQELSPDGFTILRPVRDEHGQIIDFTWVYENAAIAKLNGTNPMAVVGRRVLELFPNHAETPFYKAYMQVAESGEPCVVEAQYQGGGMAEPKWLRGAVVRSGKDICILGHDISEGKQAEEALRERERLLQTVIDGSTSPIFLKDLDGKFITINASLERMLGISREEIKGKTDYDIAPKEVADYWRTHDKQVMATRTAIQIEEVADLQDGHHVFLANKFPLVDVDGQAYGVASISHDITERKRAEEEAQRLSSFPILNPNSIVEADLNGKVLFANPSAQKLFPDLQNRGTDHPFLSDWETLKRAAGDSTNPAQREVSVDNRWYLQTVYFVKEAQRLRIYGLDITDRKRAEEALRESERRFRTMADAIPQLAWVARADGYIYWYNRRWYEYTGTTPEQMEGWGWQSVHDPQALPKVLERWNASINTGQPFDMIFPLLGADGVFRPFLTRVMPFKDEQGHVQNWFGTNTDVTEQKRIEEALRESENRFRSVVESMSEGLMLFDTDGNLIYQNPASLRIHGFGDPEVGRVERADFPSRWEGFDENGKPLQFEDWPIFRVFRRHEHFQNQVLRARRVDTGKEFFASYNGAPIYDPDGKPVLGFITIRDITQSKQAEEALRESEERKRAAEVLASSEKEFRLLAESMPQIVWTTRADGWNNYFNHQWVDYTGLTLEESYGHGWNKPFHPEDQQRAWDAWQNAVTNLAAYSLECRLRRFDGVYRWWLIRGVPDLDEKGKIIKWFGTCTDIEDLKRAEEALRQANADLDQRASQLRALAGELTLSEQRERSRLAKILHDHIQQLLVAAKFRVTILGRLGDDVIKQASKEVEELIDDSIVASRSLTAELSPPILHEAGLNAGLQWLARRMPEMQGLFVELELEEDGDLPQDIKLLLFESVRELLFNVVKHAHTRSARINVRRVDGLLQVVVSDHGVGFDPTAVPAAGEGGRGFGLFSIRERLELIGGTFEIESNPNQGSRFVLSVPVTTPTANKPELQECPVSLEAHLVAASQYPDQGRRIRVVLADDHAIFRQGIGKLLANEPDIEVIGEAGDGQEAVELAAKLLPDIILMDMSMPKLNGVEATRIIHNDCPGIRIIGLSMFEEEERSQAIRDAGAVGYVTKSGPAQDLINVIRTSIGASNKGLSAKSPSKHFTGTSAS